MSVQATISTNVADALKTKAETPRKKKRVFLAAPRGFCAGVDRAIQIVEKSIETYGAPVYVRHEIVHNRHVVSRLADLGAIFVESLDDCPDDRPVVFSAHGVPKSVPQAAKAREMNFLDATCPLVSKVHIEAERHAKEGRHILLIGHEGHPEVIGTMGQLPKGKMTLIETADDAREFEPNDASNLALVTQTTLSVDDTAELIAILQSRFPMIALPYKEDICYATTNRQLAVKAIAERCDLLMVIGSVTSSNSKRLVEVGAKAGSNKSMLISSAESIDWALIDEAETLGLSAGASAPEYLTDGVLAALKSRYDIKIEEVEVTKEKVVFRLPRQLLNK
ncbi:4-hydroxy-3-methylbut-2-enyl diphosphate reductase [Litorimonas taeanensis]|uniref:4-hydroxy-3-methylbut-2-enyl diphosphate reductase n=1 Tax=Litorimonas taeanensis TaxID=568099 RepID=A0A420WE10_9PROT|nr:4-hydroxy-3-methylbut-2-enyl diphosphate reductase [Litorimonas taeanensis]RKQ69259.1 4-hydroxy-3-methylbut-2-enyl diphosphate reductase [Litorimonas taeanensis]